MTFISINICYKLTMKHWDSEIERIIRIDRCRGHSCVHGRCHLGGVLPVSQNRVGDSKNIEVVTNHGG